MIPWYEPSLTAAGRNFNAWSVLWYVGSFAGLIGFFFIISFSEWCCKRRLWHRRNGRSATTNSSSTTANLSNDPAPPAYDLFAPPSYESIYKDGNEEKPQFDIYVVPANSSTDVVTPFCNSQNGDGTENRGSDAPPFYEPSQNDDGRRREETSEATSDGPPSYTSANHNRRKDDRRTEGHGKRRAPQPPISSASSENMSDGGGELPLINCIRKGKENETEDIPSQIIVGSS